MRKRLGIPWLPWAALVLLMGAWLYVAWVPLSGFLDRWPLAVRWPFLLVAGVLPLFGRSYGMVLGGAGVLGMCLLWWCDIVVIELVAARPIPLLAVVGAGWLPLVMRAQIEAGELLPRAVSAEAMWLRARWWVLWLGVLAGVVASEVALWFGAQLPGGGGLALLASAPILALAVLELWLRVLRADEPRYEPVARNGGMDWSAIARVLADPIALQRGHAALRFARVAAALVIVSGVIALWTTGDLFWRWRWWAVASVGVLATLVILLAPRPRPDARRRPREPSFGLPARLVALLGKLEQLRIAVEQGRDPDVWELALELDKELASLSESELELLERRRAQVEPLRAVLRVAHPITEVLDDATRRALHGRVLRFLACAQGCESEDPYRQGVSAGARTTARMDAVLRMPSMWIVGGLVSSFGVIAGLIELGPDGLVIAVPAIALLAWGFALAHARRMFAVALPDRGARALAARYSEAFERERAHVGARRRVASVIATVVAAGLCSTIMAAFWWASCEPERTFARDDLLVGASVLAAASFVIPRLRDRLREWPSVVMVRRLHRSITVPRASALLIELVAQRLRWAAAPHAHGEALEHCARLLCAVDELGSLTVADRECLRERLRDAIACGAGLERRQQRALELELATAERLLVG